MKIGVIGAGTMGQGIAQLFATKMSGEVYLCDVSKDLSAKGKESIIISLNRLVEKGNIKPEEADKIAARIHTGVTAHAKDCDLIIEAVAEKMEIKQSLFKELDTICKEETIFASNTSSLSITEISSASKRPIIGTHFFNPVSVMELVEIIRGADTTDNIVKEVKKILKSIGKVSIEIEEQPGFVVNRILIPMINEAIGVYASGTASIEDIDMAMKLGANHPLGPLALGDLVGLDICLAIMEVLLAETGDPKYRPEPLLRKMVRAGHLGKKSGKGFYEY